MKIDRGYPVTLRRLEIRDAEEMLEWMLCPDIYEKMQYDPKLQSVKQCRKYIEASWCDRTNLHYAVSNAGGGYLGTVSLKNIDHVNQTAEFAIALHPRAMGKGIASQALALMMEKAFEELDLNKVYLYVRSDNARAVAFYKKNRLEFEGCFKEHLCVRDEYKDIYWFSLRRRKYGEWRRGRLYGEQPEGAGMQGGAYGEKEEESAKAAHSPSGDIGHNLL